MESGWIDDYVTLKSETGRTVDSLIGRAGKPVDSRVLRMVEIHETQTYAASWRQRRIKTKLFAWYLRIMVLEKAKRALDLTACLLAMPFALPFMLLTALAIRIDSPGPILFRQQRVGKWGRKFTCYKFRSMVIDAEARKKDLMAQNEADQIVFKMKRDPRITRVGRIIRKLSIDELPQIFNVIKGDMSLVGPRPPVPIEVEQYRFEHFRRLDAVPGITGLQQVSGRSELDFARWVAFDVQYIEEQSIKKDIEILLKTIPAVISGKGAY